MSDKQQVKRCKKVQNSFYILYFLVLSLTISSCTGLSEISISDIKNIEIKGFEENSFLLAATLMVDNPTMHQIRITDINTKVYINGQYIGKVTTDDNIVFNARSSRDYDILLKVRLTNILGTAFTMMQLSSGSKAIFKIEGDVTAKSFLMKKKIPISESKEIKL